MDAKNKTKNTKNNRKENGKFSSKKIKNDHQGKGFSAVLGVTDSKKEE